MRLVDLELVVHLECRIAKHDPTRGHIGEHFGCAARDHAVSDKDIVADAGHSAQHHVVSDHCRARNRDVSADQTIASHDDIVANLCEVVELAPVADHSVTHGAIVDGGVCAQFDVIADAHRAQRMDPRE